MDNPSYNLLFAVGALIFVAAGIAWSKVIREPRADWQKAAAMFTAGAFLFLAVLMVVLLFR